jgi:photosystem II stability/assembly factor-like uncharacterized protein
MSLDVGGKAQAQKFCLGNDCCESWQQCIEEYGSGDVKPGIVLNFEDMSKANIGHWVTVAMSASGKYQTAIADDGIYSSSNYGRNFAKESDQNFGPSEEYVRIVMTADGRYQIATTAGDGKNFISTDYGKTWVRQDPYIRIYDIAISGDGSYRLILTDNLVPKKSSDGGNTWTTVPVPGSHDNRCSNGIVAVSANGNYQALVCDRDIRLVSTNYGQTWQEKTFFDSTDSKNKLKVSSDGQYQIFSFAAYGKPVEISSDYGNTWTEKYMVKIYNLVGPFWGGTKVGLSADGKYQVAGHSGSQDDWEFRVSPDYGNNWYAKGPKSAVDDIAVSSDGQYITGVGCYPADKGCWIYRSADWGQTWLTM